MSVALFVQKEEVGIFKDTFSRLEATVHYASKNLRMYSTSAHLFCPEGAGPITTPILICVTWLIREVGSVRGWEGVGMCAEFRRVIVAKSHTKAVDSLHSSTITIS